MAWPFRDGLRARHAREGQRPTGRTRQGFSTAEWAPSLRTLAGIGNLAVVTAIVAAFAPIGRSDAPLALVELASTNAPICALTLTSVIASLLLLLPAAGRDSVTDRTDPGRATDAAASAPPAASHEAPPEAFASALAHIGHDLRTPLNAIIGFSDMMHQEMHGPLGSDRYQSYAAHIRDSGIALLGAIETTLTITQSLGESAGRVAAPADGRATDRP